MPYSIVNDHPECDGFAVIKDDGRELMGCHRTEAQAQDQLTAINIAEYGEERQEIDETRIEKAREILLSIKKKDIE
jgi:hypothetical protein